MPKPFVHLHLHTQYSLLDGAIKHNPLFERAKSANMPAVAQTDHGNLFGTIEFYEKARANGVKPIIGCEAYFAGGSRFDRERKQREETGYDASRWDHLCTMHPCIGYSDEIVDLFLARGLSFSGTDLDEEEFLETLIVPLDEALAWIRNGRITEVKTIAGLLWAERIVSGGWPV